jgi:hypothetical protein
MTSASVAIWQCIGSKCTDKLPRSWSGLSGLAVGVRSREDSQVDSATTEVVDLVVVAMVDAALATAS